MANLFSEPVFQQLDASGDVRPGSKLSFFESQTTTPKTTYTDSGLTTPHSQPVVADGAGVFPDIYLDGTDYRAVYTDSNDVQIDVYDPISGTSLFGTVVLFTKIIEKFTASAGQTVFNLANTYSPGTNQIEVFINGVFQVPPENYIETDSDTITFTSGLTAGDFVTVGNTTNASFTVTIEKQTATAGQTLFNLTTITYVQGSNKLGVYINGVFQTTPEAYSETSTTSITFVSGLTAGDFVVFRQI